jgi:hypothetical protein
MKLCSLPSRRLRVSLRLACAQALTGPALGSAQDGGGDMGNRRWGEAPGGLMPGGHGTVTLSWFGRLAGALGPCG